jgi:hypothetical protein
MSDVCTRYVVLVGHCSPDSSYLTIAIKAVCPDARVVRANDDAAVLAHLKHGPDLLLVNRVLDGEFLDYSGVNLIARSRQSHPDTNVMLVSNYPDAQAAAAQHGALPGFGKSDLHTGKAGQTLASAFGGATL